MKKIFALLLMLTIYISGQDFQLIKAETKLEEKFIYRVGWSIFKLGTITLITENIVSYPGFVKITMDIKSAPLLPFIDIDEHNVAIMRAADGMTFFYYGTQKKDGKIVESVSRYYESGNYSLYEMKDCQTGKLIRRDTLRYPAPYLVGTSLINYTRLNVSPGVIKNVPTMLESNFYQTTLNFCGPTEYIEIDNYDEPIRVFKYEGSADWEGNATAGLSGEFSAWISENEARVVIYAEMEIILGSIEIELVEWYKPGWIPPTNKNLFVQKKK
jgi:hypothetical protein